ncbi:hypothetical protein Gpo141_00011613 [Globisporangium polare]
MSMKRSGDAGLTLGVKGQLSNQEMEALRNKLAQAVAYDHVPDAKRAERHAKALTAAKPMTKLYRKVSEHGQQDPAELPSSSHHRPGKKTLASIQYERKFIEKSFDSLKIKPPTRGISGAAKTVLQDEYVTRPRHVSSIPLGLMSDSARESAALNEKGESSGKRLAPAPIPQVFIL